MNVCEHGLVAGRGGQCGLRSAGAIAVSPTGAAAYEISQTHSRNSVPKPNILRHPNALTAIAPQHGPGCHVPQVLLHDLRHYILGDQS